jgi:DNA-binding NarL/FixJ family response regulator
MTIPGERHLPIRGEERAPDITCCSGKTALSPRELEVVEQVVDGSTNQEIAARLGVSPRTIHAHVSSAMSKTRTRTRTQLAVYALRAGIVVLSPLDDE